MIHVIENFLTNEECLKYIDDINRSIDTEKQICFSDSAGSVNHKYKNLNLANIFYQRAVEKVKNNDFVAPNDLIMWAKYLPGTEFGLHTDTGLFYDRTKRLKSRYTLLIYLNDNFEGGKTLFYDNNFCLTNTINPKKGDCIIFDIDLWHRGTTVVSGEKFWIGCEIISKF